MMREIKLIVPDWDDLVDPHYDFRSNSSSPEYREHKYKYGVRIWEVFNPPPVDGVLISISTINARKHALINEFGGARKFLKLPNDLQLMGDCGAWQYRDKDLPPYTVEDVLRLYDELGVDYGVSVDHIPFFGNPFERMQLTLENALRSYDLWKPMYEKGDYKFMLMASLQGIEIQDYLRMFDKLYEKGYRSFAVGGLARRMTGFIERLIRDLHGRIRQRKDVEKLHFLGVARLSMIPLLKKFAEVGEISFDNATFLRMAWTRTIGNYILPDGRTYTAIRIMNADNEFYELLRMYDEERVSLDEVIKALREHLIKTGDVHYLPYYMSTLSEKPWRECDCPICRATGIEVLIFKGNNRNRRRGFHNVYVFSKLLREGILEKISFRIMKHKEGNTKLETSDIVGAGWVNELRGIIKSSKKVLILTHCTATKNANMNVVSRLLTQAGLKIPSFDLENEDTYRRVLRNFIKPASEMYGGTFTAVKNLVKSFRECGKQVDFLIVSARYGIIREGDLILPYDATLKGMKASEVRRWSIERRVNQALKELAKEPYDLAIAVLPKEYFTAVKEALSQLSADKLVLISTRNSSKHLSRVKHIYLPGSSLYQRLKYVKLLTKICEEACRRKLIE